MSRRKPLLPLFSAIAWLVAAAGVAAAHSDMVAEARLEIEIGPDRSVRSLLHQWRFVAETSADVIEDFDANGDGELDEAELEDVARNVEPTLAANDYFQRVLANGRRITMNPPETLTADFDDGHLLIGFRSEPHARLPLEGMVDIRVFDATLGTVIAFESDEDMAVHGLPADCTHRVVRPDMDKTFEENRKELSDGAEDGRSESDILRIFAPRLEIICPDKAGE